jgi:ubiquinone/menaquinone biosynthesis C-methylase UbiE
MSDDIDVLRHNAAARDRFVHPLSNRNVPDCRAVWREVRRVLRPGGTLLAGFMPIRSRRRSPASSRPGSR